MEEKEKNNKQKHEIKDPNINLISYGNSKGAILDSIKYLNNDGYKVNLTHLTILNKKIINSLLKQLPSTSKTIIIERDNLNLFDNTELTRFNFNNKIYLNQIYEIVSNNS